MGVEGRGLIIKPERTLESKVVKVGPGHWNRKL